MPFKSRNYDIMTTKELLTSALLLIPLCNSPAFSQTAIDLSHNSRRTGDAIEIYKILTDNIWDLSSSNKCGNSIYERNEDFKQDTITVLFQGTRRYFEYNKDTLLYVGLENPQNKELFYRHEVSCIFPMSLGDKISGVFAGHVNYCDKLVLHKFGTYTTHADSIGTLTLPNGNIVANALQISCRRKIMYEQIDSCDTDSILPQYTKAEILGKQSEGTDIYTEVEKNIYIKGYRYPIIRDMLLYNPKGELCQSETYYAPPEGQDLLYLDEPNLEARRDQVDLDNNSPLNDAVDVSSFINNRPSSMEVSFDIGGFLAKYPQNGTDQCRLLLSDNRGIVYRTRNYTVTPAANQEISLSYSGLRNGQYVLSVVINNQIYTNNFIIG